MYHDDRLTVWPCDQPITTAEVRPMPLGTKFPLFHNKTGRTLLQPSHFQTLDLVNNTHAPSKVLNILSKVLGKMVQKKRYSNFLQFANMQLFIHVIILTCSLLLTKITANSDKGSSHYCIKLSHVLCTHSSNVSVPRENQCIESYRTLWSCSVDVFSQLIQQLLCLKYSQSKEKQSTFKQLQSKHCWE